MKQQKQLHTKKKCILIIEDERPLAHALELKLGSVGYDTKVVLTGSEGLKEGQNGCYDLILLDLILPEADGFSLLRFLQERNVHTPVIVLSNLGQEEDRRRAEEYGVAGYYVKSNTPLSELVRKVQSLL